MLHRRGAELVGEARQQRLADGAVVAEDAHLDQAVRGQRGVEFRHDGRRGAVAADQHHRVEMVGEGALRLAFGGSEVDGGHGRIIRARAPRRRRRPMQERE